ncbi:MAG: hypothetical protein WC759_00760, partial [Candidatus Micrarchaeia archaeon]
MPDDYDLGPLIKKFDEFFDSQYREEVEKLAANYPTKRSMEVDYRRLEKFDYELADELLKKPDDVLKAAEEAISEMSLPKMPG